MLTPSIEAWLHQVLDTKTIGYTVSQGGANNLGLIIETDQQRFFLKCFEPSNQNTGFKQENEFQFVCALNDANINNVPTPIAINKELCVSLFSFIDGSKISQPSCENISAAIDFINSINQANIDYSRLNQASEAVNKLIDFPSNIAARLAKFKQLSIESDKNSNALNTMLLAIEQHFAKCSAQIPEHWHNQISEEIVSPSDFGFHNALQTTQAVYFIDFEYAGLDSPWKLFCDTFAQPAVPIPLSFAGAFLSQAVFAPLISSPTDLLKAYELTLLKWCLIMLNEFLPQAQKRRMFAWSNSCIEPNTMDIKQQQAKLQQAQCQQLAKCQLYFDNISTKVEQLNQILRDK